MIPYDLDPSLHTAAPESPLLDDGFSPPPQGPADDDKLPEAAHAPAIDPALWAKSAF